MKKVIKMIGLIILFIICIITIIFLYLFIGNINKSPKIGTWVIHKTNNKYISMNVKKETITNQSITTTFINHTNEEYNYGASYTLEYYRDGFWHYIQPIENACFLLKSITLEPHSTQEISFNWGDYYGKLSSGKYRIVKKISSNDNKYDFYVSAEFIID